MDHPSVGVVVVNYNGGDLTMACLRSLLGSSWPDERLRIVLVDNASSDDVVTRVRAELPVVVVVENTENVGFGAGCNRGIRAAGDVDYVALVNNDATVDPGWLDPLVDALDADPGIGAACPKILFAGAYREIALRSPTTQRGRGDARDLGVLVAGARVDGIDVWRRVHLVDGTWGVEPGLVDGAAWTSAVAHLQVPVPDGAGASTTTLLLSADTPRAVELRSGDAVVVHPVDREPAWYEVPTGGPAIRVVNNTGTELAPGGFGVDRGFQEPDDGRYDDPVEVFAWCGAAVLLRAGYLDDVGTLRRGPVPVLRGPRAGVAGVDTRMAIPVRPDVDRAPRPHREQRQRVGVQAVLRRTQPPARAQPARVTGGRRPRRGPFAARHRGVRPPRSGRPPARGRITAPGDRPGPASGLGWLCPGRPGRRGSPTSRIDARHRLDEAVLHGVEDPRDDDVEHLVERWSSPRTRAPRAPSRPRGRASARRDRTGRRSRRRTACRR